MARSGTNPISPGWPNAPLVFKEDGQLEPLPAKYAFSVVFVFCPLDGSLELVAKDTKAMQYPLQRAFCRAVLGLDVKPADPLRPVYDLSMLLDPNFNFPTDPRDRLAEVRLVSIRLDSDNALAPIPSAELSIGHHLRRRDCLDFLNKSMVLYEMNPDRVTVQAATIEFLFIPFNGACPRQMKVTVTVPHTSDLKDNRPPHQHETNKSRVSQVPEGPR